MPRSLRLGISAYQRTTLDYLQAASNCIVMGCTLQDLCLNGGRSGPVHGVCCSLQTAVSGKVFRSGAFFASLLKCRKTQADGLSLRGRKARFFKLSCETAF